MARKLASITQEMANIFPPWSKVREDEQSLGWRVLNSVALPLEIQQKEVIRHTRNYHLPVANMDELAWAHRVDLPPSFAWAELQDDALETIYEPPVASGLYGGVYHSVEMVESNTLAEFALDRVPDRVGVGLVLSGENVLLSDTADNAPFSSVLEPFRPGKFSVELSGGVRYIEVEDGDYLRRGRVVLHGTTRKGTRESETLAFPWDQTQKTFKEWREIDSVECLEVEAGVAIEVRVCDFFTPPYQSFWSLEFSSDRRKIDTFWGSGATALGSSLDFWKYSTDDVSALIEGLYQMVVDRRFELLDAAGAEVTVADISEQPFSDFVWAVSESKLYCFDSSLTTVEGISALASITPGHEIEVQLSSDHVIRGDEVEVVFANGGPFNAAFKYRLWVEYPDGTRQSIVAGQLESYVEGSFLDAGAYREALSQNLYFTPAMLGEHVFVAEARLADNTTHLHKRVLCVDSKTALAEFDLPLGVSGVTGIDFDGDQRLWIEAAGGHYPVSFHYDVMLVDFENKVIYFREPYDSVGVES